MNKTIKLIIIAIVSFPLLYIIIGLSLHFIEEYIETNTYHILIYNYSNDEIVITINDKYTINVEGRVYFWDRVFYDKVLNKDNKYNNNYLIKSNGNIIFNREMDGVIGSFSAGGGLLTNIVINKIDENNNDVVFTFYDSEKGNWLELKSIKRKKFTDIFNRDGLNY